MNSKVFITFTIITSIILIFFIGLLVENPVKVKKPASESGPVFNKERDKYLWERMRDPATGEMPKNIRSRELAFARNRWIEPYMKSSERLLSNNIWERRGPFEVGGRTRGFALDIRNENIIIAGGVSSGMWKSLDGGSTWAKTSLPFQLHSVTCLAQDKRAGKEDVWYYGTGEYWGNSAAITGDGIFKSTDNGNSWNLLQSTATSKPQVWDNTFDYCWNIVTNPAAPLEIDEVVAATTYRGILRSTDGGTTWVNVIGAQDQPTFTDVAVTSKGEYYATLSSDSKTNVRGIFRSDDGVKWVNITPANFPKRYNRIVIGISPSDESQVYFVGVTPGYGKLTFNAAGDSLWHSLWKYDFKGSGDVVIGDWEDRSDNLPNPEPTRGQMNSQSGYNLVIKVKPDNPDVVFIGAVALYRSESGFKNNDWSWIGGTCPDETCDYFYRYPNHHADVHQLVFSYTNYNVLYSGSDGGIHKTLNDMAEKVEWISLNNGYFTTQFYSVAIDHGPNLSREIIGGLQDNGTLLSRKPDMQTSIWTNPLKADGFCCQIPNGGAYYYASQNSTWQPKIKIFRVVHDENGNNTVATRIDPVGGLDFIWNTPFILDPNNNDIMYLAGGRTLWRNNNLSEIPFVNSTDSTAVNWDSLSYTSINPASSDRITAVSVSKKPANIVYYGSRYGNLFKIVDADKGNPVPVNVTGNDFPNGYVSSIAFDPDNADIVIVSFSNYNILSIFMTTDGGNNWFPISGNLEERPDGGGSGPGVNWVNILKVNNKKVYFAGTNIGLFSTAFINGTATAWQMEGPESIGNMVIDMVDVRQEDGYVAVATHGTGVFDGFYKTLPDIPSSVTLASPESGTKNVLLSVLLQWKPAEGLGFYELEIAKDPNFVEIVHTVSGIAATEYNWLNVIEQGRITYYWRVRNSGPGGVSEYSEVWNFTSAIGPPNIVFPTPGTDQVMTSFSFKWQQVEGADHYALQAASGFDINSPIIDTIITGTEFFVENFLKNHRYIWRIASIEDGFQGVFGETYHFYTRHPLSVKGFQDDAISISIKPNPVNDAAYISIYSDKQITGQLILFDINGRVIQIIANQMIQTGGVSFPIQSGHLAAGIYNVVFVTDDKRFYQKMQVVR
ncbi:MAG: T9SS type A sorting domain-containing protein [Candidatus Kapabacteria bacterium]|nr:T9SS type A sorting domain-containing protein [Candidatus Kapabacteria bacterium]